jgi:hypothetical protein
MTLKTNFLIRLYLTVKTNWAIYYTFSIRLLIFLNQKKLFFTRNTAIIIWIRTSLTSFVTILTLIILNVNIVFDWTFWLTFLIKQEIVFLTF